MKKLNKKGFTLIELLAVIVVLAIIMVIATQQVNSTIKKSRANTYADTVMSIKKGLQTVCATDATITNSGITSAIDFSDIKLTGVNGTSQIEVSIPEGSKYKNLDQATLNNALKNKSNISLTTGTEVYITTDCTLGEAIDISR